MMGVCLAVLLAATSSALLVPTNALGGLESPCIVDARSAEEYGAGHIPGAVHLDVPLLSEKRDGTVNLLKPLDEVRNLLGLAGVDPARHVVVYSDMGDEKKLTFATRLFWLLEYLGYPRVSLLDGGIGKWTAEGRALETGACEYGPVELEAFTPDENKRAYLDEVKRISESGGDGLVDIRPLALHLGRKKKPYVSRPGHIPNSSNVPTGELLDSETHLFLPKADLQAAFLMRGVNGRRRVVLYCNSGNSATAGYLAARLTGFKNVAAYDGSMAEWASRGDLSMETDSVEELRVLAAEPGGRHPGRMMTVYLNGLAEAASQRRLAALEALKTPEEIATYQERTRRFFVEQLGGWPKKTPLNARVVEVVHRDGYRVEKIIYESRPRFFVTAALFSPTSEPPYPAVLVPCGHSANGKASEVYQRAGISLAKNGIAAMIYDPIDQGERFQLLAEDGKGRLGGTTGHTMTGQGCILLGTNTAAYRIWDGIRGIDYLVSRPEIDPERIGCTGNSGGGTLTSYLMALDERVQCAAPSCYLTSFPRLLEKTGPQDSEQNIYGQIAFGMEHGDYVMMRAPKPTLLCSATFDFFDIRGTWDTFREAKRLYTKLGFAERVDLVEAPESHGFSLLLRQGMVRWMRRWLLQIDEPVVEAEFPVLTEEEIQCTPDGQVMLLEDAQSVYDLNVAQETRLAEGRAQFWQTETPETALAKVRELAGIRLLAELPEPEVEEQETLERPGYKIRKLVLYPEDGVRLPALLFVPETIRTACLYVHGGGKAIDAMPGGPIEQLVLEGGLVLAPDLRGMGETMTTEGSGGWRDRFGPGWQDFYRAYLLGRSYVGMRTEDILVCARYLAACEGADSPRPVRLIGIGEAGIPALHAAALEPGLFDGLRLERTLPSWVDVVNSPEAKEQLQSTVHGALRFYDLPDLIETLPAERVTIADPLAL
ncbi:MAG: prolyl oligopeptidase family serine peptidase [Nitrospiraceae bacterium]|nr:prolyl oligopeptidase family serine peptidase [Nitrospiraceae bacterium]